jgi:hypothetical protein
MINFKIPNKYRLKNKKINIFISYLIYFIIGGSITFGRPFVGLYVFGIRLGELIVLIGFTFSILLAFFYFKGFTELFNNKKVFTFLVASFFIVMGITNSDFLNPYAYRNSSYIWFLSYVFIGYMFLATDKINHLVLSVIVLIPPFMYFISTGNYPNFIMQLFIDYSDKFQFLKGSELTIGFIASTFFTKHLNFTIKFKFTYLAIVGAIYIPLLLFVSRGAFIAGVMFIFLEIYSFRHFIKKHLIYTLIITILASLFLILSIYRVEGSLSFDEITQAENVTTTIENIAAQKKTKNLFLGFYINGNGYLDSWDPTTSWRLDIWQDLYYDMSENKILLSGHGYKEIFPIMLDPTAPGRLGRDGLNENVHNFIFNILGRGGIFQVLIYLVFQIFLLAAYRRKHKNLRIINLILPLFFMSLFDATMESVNFPLVLYTFYGYFLKNGCEEPIEK